MYNITKSVAPLIHNFYDRLYESKHVITLQGTVIRHRLRKYIGSITQQAYKRQSTTLIYIVS